ESGFTTCFSEFSSEATPLGRPKWASRMTFAPFRESSAIVGTMRSIRVRSVTSPFAIGTLRSTRTSTRLDLTSASSRVRKLRIFPPYLSFGCPWSGDRSDRQAPEKGWIVGDKPVLIDGQFGGEGAVSCLVAIAPSFLDTGIALLVAQRAETVKRHVKHVKLNGAAFRCQAKAADGQRVGEGCSRQIDIDAAVEFGQCIASHRVPAALAVGNKRQPVAGRGFDQEMED